MPDVSRHRPGNRVTARPHLPDDAVEARDDGIRGRAGPAHRSLPRLQDVRGRVPVGRAVRPHHRSGTRRRRRPAPRVTQALDKRLRDANMKTYRGRDFDALVVDSAGCGAHLKDFYPELKGRVKDLTEWLAEIGLPSAAHDVRIRVTYQDACHLAHAQRIKKQPRDLIRSLPGADFVEMRHAEICCGAAGLYSTLEPEMSARILQEKLDDLLATEADVVAVANPGCQMQLESGLRGRG